MILSFLPYLVILEYDGVKIHIFNISLSSYIYVTQGPKKVLIYSLRVVWNIHKPWWYLRIIAETRHEPELGSFTLDISRCMTKYMPQGYSPKKFMEKVIFPEFRISCGLINNGKAPIFSLDMLSILKSEKTYSVC
jgi:hypothetical protein